MRVLLVGASGAIGQRLIPLLLDAGHDVIGTTRSATKTEALRTLGAEPVVVDVYDLPALRRAVAEAVPDVVIDQLTDLALIKDPSQLAEALRRNARTRREGTQNIVSAALAAGVSRVIAQSIAWTYAPGPEPHDEDDPLDIHADGTRAITVAGVVELERVMLTPPVDGVVLRYGHLYGPNTGTAHADAPALHVDAAAMAALLALDSEHRGIFNIAEPSAYLSTDRASRELGFDPSFRLNIMA